MNKMKLFAGIIVFGSIWGFSECIIGPAMSDMGLPSGIIMTGLFAMVFLTISRMLFRQRGMQMGMGFTAGALRLFNPFMGCHICSALAIMAEGIIFELIWNYATTSDLKNFNTTTMKSSLGIITAFSVYVGGYVVTQILTPLLYAGFYIENLISLIPQILSAGLIAALIGGITIPLTLSLRRLDLSLKDRLYYPVTIGISVFCWFMVIGNWLMIGA